ncbi:protein TOC75-3, chloroplastic [Tanacetum coccineum]
MLQNIKDRVYKWYNDEGYACAKVVNFGNFNRNEVVEWDITRVVIQFQDMLGNVVEGNTQIGIVKRELPKQDIERHLPSFGWSDDDSRVTVKDMSGKIAEVQKVLCDIGYQFDHVFYWTILWYPQINSSSGGRIPSGIASQNARTSTEKLGMTSEQNVIKCSHWLELARGNDAWIQTNTPKGKFCTKSSANKAHMLQRSGSASMAICVIDSNPTASREDLMIGKNGGFGLRGASNKLEDLEASISGYKYETILTQKNHQA